MSTRTISSSWVQGVAEAMAAQGLDVPLLFGAAGLDMGALDQPDARFSSEKINRLWELAALRSGNPAIALGLTQVPRRAASLALGYAMMSSASLHDALERLARYARIFCDSVRVVVVRQGDGCLLTLDVFTEGRAVPQPRIDYFFLTLLTFCRWMTGQPLCPVGVAWAYPAPSDPQPYRDAFGCPPTFHAAANTMRFAARDAAMALPTANRLLSEMHERLLGEHLLRMDANKTSDRVRDAVVRHVPGGEPTLGDIASALGMGERSLQRHLLNEGTSFRLVLDDTRRQLASQYLGRRDYSLGQIAYLLGFADQSNFFRASKRWFQASPGQYRAHCQQEPQAGAMPSATLGL